MNKNIQLNNHESLADRTLPGVRKGKLDLVILRYIARRVYVALHSLDQATNTARPLLFYLDERHRRTHRMAIYNPEELLLTKELAFVGFISGKLKPIRPSVTADLRIMDKKLVAELVNTPGLLSYSSLELRESNWCNLVLFSHPDTKMHITNNDSHKYAAYELAPRCYEWIRLHNGIMPAGLAGNEMLLQRTKYYTFQEPQRTFVMREVRYEV